MHHQLHSQQLSRVHVAAGVHATLTLLLTLIAAVSCELCACHVSCVRCVHVM